MGNLDHVFGKIDPGDIVGHVAQQLHLFLLERAGLGVEHAQRPQHQPVGRAQRIGEQRVAPQILHVQRAQHDAEQARRRRPIERRRSDASPEWGRE